MLHLPGQNPIHDATLLRTNTSTQHMLCPNCTRIHIIDKDEKRCPLCRVEFHDDRYSLERKIITVVGQEDQFISDVRQMMLAYMAELNSHQVKEIERELAVGDEQVMRELN